MTAQNFHDAWPAFKNVNDGLIDAQIAASDDRFDPARWGVSIDYYRGAWIAHMLVITGADGAPVATALGIYAPAVEANDVTSRDTETIKISRSEALLRQQDNDHFHRTTFGQIYAARVREIGMGGAAV